MLTQLLRVQLAKMLRYLGFSTMCDITFVLFMGSWLVTRHFLFLFAIKSSWYDAPRIIPAVWDPSIGHFMTKEVLRAFNSMLIALQVSDSAQSCHITSPFYFIKVIQLIWFWMVCRVAWRVVSGQGAEDSRSDDEMCDVLIGSGLLPATDKAFILVTTPTTLTKRKINDPRWSCCNDFQACTLLEFTLAHLNLNLEILGC